MAHAQGAPDKSLGVGAFSVAQRDAVLDELELLRQSDPAIEHFFVTARPEPFFVKNLENIQGDERDVIFISVGYGKDNAGYMTMGFGPLSIEGGERRLNVLITRRDSCSVFSSIHGDDIDPARAHGRGARALKTFLTYAETGLLDTAVITGRDFDSEFERQVARAVEANVCRVEPQVGVAGFRIDLAVVDPEMQGRYLLGIECDGASYHDSRSARDRDRLAGPSWRIVAGFSTGYWSTDWFRRPEEELRKVLAAVERAKIEWAAHFTVEHEPQEPIATVEHDAAEPGEAAVEPVADYRVWRRLSRWTELPRHLRDWAGRFAGELQGGNTPTNAQRGGARQLLDYAIRRRI